MLMYKWGLVRINSSQIQSKSWVTVAIKATRKKTPNKEVSFFGILRLLAVRTSGVGLNKLFNSVILSKLCKLTYAKLVFALALSFRLACLYTDQWACQHFANRPHRLVSGETLSLANHLDGLRLLARPYRKWMDGLAGSIGNGMLLRCGLWSLLKGMLRLPWI